MNQEKIIPYVYGVVAAVVLILACLMSYWVGEVRGEVKGYYHALHRFGGTYFMTEASGENVSGGYDLNEIQK